MFQTLGEKVFEGSLGLNASMCVGPLEMISISTINFTVKKLHFPSSSLTFYVLISIPKLILHTIFFLSDIQFFKINIFNQ